MISVGPFAFFSAAGSASNGKAIKYFNDIKISVAFATLALPAAEKKAKGPAEIKK